jgi:2-(1,2-epoxy-1,2-dihydrophenyl)acetyl-CoA isomerase
LVRPRVQRRLRGRLENRPLDSETCRALGLLNRVVDDDALRAEALTWARSLANGPRTMQRFVKQNVREAEGLPLPDYLPLEAERMTRSARTDEHRALIKAWLTRASERK